MRQSDVGLAPRLHVVGQLVEVFDRAAAGLWDGHGGLLRSWRSVSAARGAAARLPKSRAARTVGFSCRPAATRPGRAASTTPSPPAPARRDEGLRIHARQARRRRRTARQPLSPQPGSAAPARPPASTATDGARECSITRSLDQIRQADIAAEASARDSRPAPRHLDHARAHPRPARSAGAAAPEPPTAPPRRSATIPKRQQDIAAQQRKPQPHQPRRRRRHHLAPAMQRRPASSRISAMPAPSSPSPPVPPATGSAPPPPPYRRAGCAGRGRGTTCGMRAQGAFARPPRSRPRGRSGSPRAPARRRCRMRRLPGPMLVAPERRRSAGQLRSTRSSGSRSATSGT